jgi:PleD family two-component response regulator
MAIMLVRALLVESEPEYVLFMKDVIMDIESGRHWNSWVHIEILHTATLSAALTIVSSEVVDVILLNPDLSDSQGIGTFRRMQSCSDRVPIVLLVGPEDEGMAIRLVRDGAQDFLFRRCIDCAPLSHAMRNAIERHRLLSAARARASTDSLTGLINRGAFLTLADRDRKVAERVGRRLMIVVAEPVVNLCDADEQRQDLTMVELADHLRSLGGPTDLMARIGRSRFAMTVLETDLEPLEEIWARIHSSAAEHRIQVGVAIFTPDCPTSLDVLLEQASLDLTPAALATRARS